MRILLLTAGAAATAVLLYRHLRRRPRAPVERLDRAQQRERRAGCQRLIDVEKISAAAAADDSSDAAVSSWRYPKPPANPGACSREMAAAPFDAVKAAQDAVPGADATSTLRRLRSLRAICAYVAERTSAQWCGVYQTVPKSGADLSAYGGSSDAPNLLKLAYVGSPSRPYFPLTAAFAEGSNNSTVGMSGVAVVYHDVLALPSDSPYYTCDAQVRSEACVPIFAPDGGDEVIGIMDCEGFAPDLFRSAHGLGVVLEACAQLSERNLLRPVTRAAAVAETRDDAERSDAEPRWEAHACRLPARASAADKAAVRASVTTATRDEYFRLSCCPINASAEQRMEQVSSIVCAEMYNDHWAAGVYACARCGHHLYDCGAKFVGPCLWPSFRGAFGPRSLHTVPVARGAYNEYACEVHELYCGACELFLGHAFEDGRACGDTHPAAGWRHCVLSLSLDFRTRAQQHAAALGRLSRALQGHVEPSTAGGGACSRAAPTVLVDEPSTGSLVYLVPDLLSPAEHGALFEHLRAWDGWARASDDFGPQARLTAYCGDGRAVFSYVGLVCEPRPWPPCLSAARDRVNALVGAAHDAVCTGCLLNNYEPADGHIPFHSDEVRAHGATKLVVSLSLGGARAFLLRRRGSGEHPDEARRVMLPPGSALVMAYETQAHWEHALPLEPPAQGAPPAPHRISLTFRSIEVGYEEGREPPHCEGP